MSQRVQLQNNFVLRLFSRILHLYFRMLRGMTLGVRVIVRSNEGKFLLVKHTYTLGWHFPGGGVELSQTAEDAVIDELLQETGLKVSGKPVLHGVFLNREVSQRDHVLLYSCETLGDLHLKPQSLEIADAAFYGADELPTDLDPGTKRRIREIVRATQIDQYW